LVGNGPIAAFAAAFEHLRRRDGLIVPRSSAKINQQAGHSYLAQPI